MAARRRVALLPLPLLALCVAAGIAVGGAFGGLDPKWLAGLPAAAVASAGSYVLRRLFPRVGARSFEELPSAYDDERSSYGSRVTARVLGGWSLIVTCLIGIVVLRRFDVEEASAVAAGIGAGLPVWFEVDARLGLRAQASATRRRGGSRTRRRRRAAPRATRSPPGGRGRCSTPPFCSLRPRAASPSLFADESRGVIAGIVGPPRSPTWACAASPRSGCARSCAWTATGST